MPRGHPHRDHAAKGLAKNNRFFDAEDPAQIGHIIGPLIQGPGVGRSAGPATATVVEIHHLRAVCEPVKMRAERCVIVSRTAMQHQQCWSGVVGRIIWVKF